MYAAIYSRKSKFTGKGESVENQIQLCKEYGIKQLNIDENDFIIYEDEGFSGSNTKRPEFQRMMKDAEDNKINIIICYRLDRISRNISDFANLIETLNRDNIGFVSIREQFDTTTPMGRAMMYIASVFSQLERETIAERIKDNMLQLAKTGRWLGGVPPTGYKSEPVINIDYRGKERKLFKLAPIEEEQNLVKLIYSKYLSLKSMTQVEKYLVQNNMRTKNGLCFNRHSIRLILSNPVYAIADRELYDYLIQNGYNVCSDIKEFNGINGLMSYNKTNQDKNRSSQRCNDSTEWIVAIGLHEGIIPSLMWIKTQKLLAQNKSKAYRKVKSSKALLSGILRCGGCGSFMRPKTMQRTDAFGDQVFYYICEMKEKSRKSRCIMSNVNGNTLDRQIQDELKKIIINNPPVFEDICKKNKKKMPKIQSSKTIEEISDNLSNLDASIRYLMNIHEKRILIKIMVDKILWDGEKLDIILNKHHMFPQCEDSK